MRSVLADGDPRLLAWLRVREFAVPPSMIETATARRVVGDWAGACAAARVDADVDPRAVARTHGRELSARLRADLRHLAPDLLRWHMPRVAPYGLLRPGLTVSLARYEAGGSSSSGGARSSGACLGGAGDDRSSGARLCGAAGDSAGSRRGLHLVARTPPAWAESGQRISLALWDGSPGRAGPHPHPGLDRCFGLDLHPRPRLGRRFGVDLHPHPRPDRRFRLDLHRHLWDVRHAGELRERAGVATWPVAAGGRATHRWAAEADIVRRAEGRAHDPVSVRLAARHYLALHPDDPVPRPVNGPAWQYPMLPDAATWVLPDLALLRAGLIDPGRLHPLVATALAPDVAALAPGDGRPGDGRPGGVTAGLGSGGRSRAPRLVECQGARHRIGIVGGVLSAFDHDPEELRREAALVALGGSPLPCLRAIDTAGRDPAELDDVRCRLDHGDTAGALAVVEGLLGREAVLAGGALRDELDAAAARRVTYGLYRSGLAGRGPLKTLPASHRR